MTAAIEDAKIRLYDLLGGLYPVLKTVGEVLVPVAQLIPLINLLTSGLGRAAAAVKVKTAAMRVATAVSGTYKAALNALTAATGSARIATIALQATLTLGLSLAIQAVITLIQHLTQRKREEREATEALSDADDSYAQTLVDAKSRMSVLIAELRSFSGSKDEEKAKVDELNSVYGDTFGTYQTVRDWYDVLIARSGDYVQMLVNEAKIRDMASRAAEASMKADSLQAELDATPRTVDRWLGLPTVAPKDNPEYLDLQKQLDGQLKIVSEGNASLQALVEENARIKQGLSAPLPSSGTDTAGAGSGQAAAEMKKVLTDLDSVFAQIEVRNGIFGQSQNDLVDKIRATESAINSLISKNVTKGASLDALIARYRELTELQRQRGGEKLTQIPDLPGMPVSSNGSSVPQIKMPEPEPGPIDLYNQRLAQMQQNAQNAQQGLSALGSMMGSISGVVGEGAGQWLQYGANVLSAVGQTIAAITALIPLKREENNVAAQGAIIKSAESVSGTPFVGWVMALAAIASMTAALLSIPKFAKGGIAFGPTLGLFGEYPGASSNPEVVAPLDRLRSMLRPDDGAAGRVRFVIEGRDLVGIMDRMDRFNGRTR